MAVINSKFSNPCFGELARQTFIMIKIIEIFHKGNLEVDQNQNTGHGMIRNTSGFVIIRTEKKYPSHIEEMYA